MIPIAHIAQTEDVCGTFCHALSRTPLLYANLVTFLHALCAKSPGTLVNAEMRMRSCCWVWRKDKSGKDAHHAICLWNCWTDVLQYGLSPG
jgi:hypothetical protein